MIGAETSRNTYTGNGSVSNYSYSYPIEANADLIVRVLSPGGVQYTLALTTDYTVNDAGDPDGGSIDLVAGTRTWLTSNKLTTSWRIIIRRRVELTQEVLFSSAGGNLLSILQAELDRVVMQMQGMQDEIDRSIKLPETLTSSDFDPFLPADTVVNGANKIPVINDDGDAFELTSASDYLGTVINGEFAISNSMAATDVTGMTVDSDHYYSAIFTCEITRSTNLMIHQTLHLFYRNGAWELQKGQIDGTIPEGSGYEDDPVHGLTWTVTESAGIAQVQVATDTKGAGLIKFKRMAFDV